jgi:hypothetical protein
VIRPPITRQVMLAFTERACAGVWPRTRWRDTVSALRSTSVLGAMAELASPCRTFGVSETCYRYSPLLSDENEEIADLLVGLTTA